MVYINWLPIYIFVLDQSNRPTLSLSSIKPLNYVEDIDVSLPLDQQWWVLKLSLNYDF